MFKQVRCGRWFLLRATECCILQCFLVLTCRSKSFQVGNLGGKLLVISRILTVQRMAMRCGPVCLQPWMPCMGAWFKHGCFGQRMLWEHERYYGFGMDALVSICSWNTNSILDARRRVAAQTVSPKFYTVDPTVLPNDIAAELLALLLKDSSDALSFLFWHTSAWRPLKGLPAKSVGKKNNWKRCAGNSSRSVLAAILCVQDSVRPKHPSNRLVFREQEKSKILQFRAFISASFKP